MILVLRELVKLLCEYLTQNQIISCTIEEDLLACKRTLMSLIQFETFFFKSWIFKKICMKLCQGPVLAWSSIQGQNGSKSNLPDLDKIPSRPHCKPIPVMKTRFSMWSFSHREKPVFIAGVPCIENRFFPVWKNFTGKYLYWPCTGLQYSD